jgi:hypothetical protein
MTDTIVIPKLNRSPRTSETRETTARRKSWAPPSRLDAPPAPEGFKHRWIRAESGGVDDRINVQAKLREGYELVRGDEYPDFAGQAMDAGAKNAGVISVGSLLLARIPNETADERRAYYNSRTQDQLKAVDNDLLKSNAHSSMKINRPERQSRVSIGGPKATE